MWLTREQLPVLLMGWLPCPGNVQCPGISSTHLRLCSEPYAMSEEPIQTLAKDTSKNQSEWMRREWWSEVTTFPVHLLPLSSKQEKQIHSGLCFQIRQTGIPGVWISIILWWSHVPFIFLNSVCMWMCAYVPKKAQDDLSTCPMSQDSGK